MAVAGAVVVAQTFGAKDHARVDHAAGQTLVVVTGISLALSVVGYALSGPVVDLFGPEAAVAGQAAAYLRISFVGLVAVFVYFVFQALLRGVGDVKTPMIIVGGTVVLNFFLDPLLILGWGGIPGYGVVGAAWATVIAQGLAGVLGLVLLFSGRYGIHLRARHLTPDWPLVATIVRLGIPSSIEQSARALGLTVMMLLVAGFGTTVIASYGIGSRILSFVIIPAMGLSMATSTVVGQNVGARQDARAGAAARLGMLAGFIGLSVAGAGLFLLAEPIVRLFVPDEPEVIAVGEHFIYIMAAGLRILRPADGDERGPGRGGQHLRRDDALPPVVLGAPVSGGLGPGRPGRSRAGRGVLVLPDLECARWPDCRRLVPPGPMDSGGWCPPTGPSPRRCARRGSWRSRRRKDSSRRTSSLTRVGRSRTGAAPVRAVVGLRPLDLDEDRDGNVVGVGGELDMRPHTRSGVVDVAGTPLVDPLGEPPLLRSEVPCRGHVPRWCPARRRT